MTQPNYSTKTVQFTYGWEALKPTHPTRPEWLLALRDAVYAAQDAEAEYIERIGGSLGAGFDPVEYSRVRQAARAAETEYSAAYAAWQEQEIENV